MGKVDDRDIYEIKRWLNDDVQNVNRLSEIVGGGGGSSDFSTAELKLINDTGLTVNIPLANIYGDDIFTTVDSEDGTDFTVILYKGKVETSVPVLDAGLRIEGAGNVIVDGRKVTITGDCTLTVIQS